MSYLPILCGVLAGCALRLYVLARQERKRAEKLSQGLDVHFQGIEQRVADRLVALPGAPTHDAELLAQWFANHTGSTILGREVDGDGIIVAIPDP